VSADSATVAGARFSWCAWLALLDVESISFFLVFLAVVALGVALTSDAYFSDRATRGSPAKPSARNCPWRHLERHINSQFCEHRLPK